MSINKSLVSTFQLLQKYDEESKKFTKLSILYGKLDFNTKLHLKFYNDFQANRQDISKLAYFKNTNIDTVLEKISDEDKQSLITNLKDAFQQAKSGVMGQDKHECGDNCSHNDKQLNSMLSNKKISKMLKKKGVKQALEAQLGKQFNIKNGNLEDMLKSAMKDNLPEGEFNMLNSVIGNPMVKQLTEKVLTEENMNKMKDIFMEFIADDEVADEINNIKQIFNEKKVMTVLTSLFSKVKGLDDISNIQSLVENSDDIKDIVNTFEKAMKSGLINEGRLMALAQKAADKFMAEFKNMDILDGKSMGMLKTVMGQFGAGSLFGDDKTEKKLTKQERAERRRKNYRRQRRKELKNKRGKKRGNKKQ